MRSATTEESSDWVVLFVAIIEAMLGLVLAAKGDDVAAGPAGWLFFVLASGLSFRMAACMTARQDGPDRTWPTADA